MCMALPCLDTSIHSYRIWKIDCIASLSPDPWSPRGEREVGLLEEARSGDTDKPCSSCGELNGPEDSTRLCVSSHWSVKEVGLLSSVISLVPSVESLIGLKVMAPTISVTVSNLVARPKRGRPVELRTRSVWYPVPLVGSLTVLEKMYTVWTTSTKAKRYRPVSKKCGKPCPNCHNGCMCGTCSQC